jgi:hypothetical protein
MRIPQSTRSTEGTDGFWSDSYRGHTIAAVSRGNGWLVYVDHVLQHNKLFATVEAAGAWLRRQIDAATPSGTDFALGEG